MWLHYWNLQLSVSSQVFMYHHRGYTNRKIVERAPRRVELVGQVPQKDRIISLL